MKITFLICLYLAVVPLLAQVPNGLSYQGIARNAQGTPLANTTIAVRLSIASSAGSGNMLYSETKSVNTNAFGLYHIAINDGGGSRTGDFDAINWNSGTKFLHIEIDPANGTAFVDMGTSQIQSVPYAMQAGRAVNLTGIINPQDGDLMEYGNGRWHLKPKAQRLDLWGLGANPSNTLKFLSSTATVTILKDNPTITIVAGKFLGSALAAGAAGLEINLGYQKLAGVITEFNASQRNSGLRVSGGNRVLFSRAGTYQTDFKAGDTYTFGLVGMLPNASPASWNDNGSSSGYIEISY